MAASEQIAFSPDQQAAVLGLALLEPVTWVRLDALGASKDWAVDQRLVALFEHVAGYRRYYAKPPAVADLLQYVHNVDPTLAKPVAKDVEWCTTAARAQDAATLLLKLRSWAEARAMVEAVSACRDAFNAGDHPKAKLLYLEGAGRLHQLDVGAGGDSIRSSPDRFEEEEAERLAEGKTILPYGVTFLDDLLGGVIRKELILVSAREGIGKTELAKIVARNVAATGRRVDAYFLEAEQNEIERRIKFEMCATRWRRDNPGIGRGVMAYRGWRQSRLEAAFAPYRDEVLAEYRARYSTLHTYYRQFDSFGIAEIDREFIRAAKAGSQLIILDHLHYVDLAENKDENRAYLEAIKRIRSLVLSLGVPVLLVVHLRKEASTRLVPDMADIHGSSNISKVSTTQIMLGPAEEVVSADTRTQGYPTFCRITKSRLGGADVRWTGVLWYDPERGDYLPVYAVGRLNYAATKWAPLKSDWPAWTQEGHLVKDVAFGS